MTGMYESAAFRKHALIPKPRDKGWFIPAIPDGPLGSLLTDLTPRERRAMRHIATNADLLDVDGKSWLLVPATRDVVDTLAEFEADMEDRENDLGDEKDEGEEDDRVSDNAFDYVPRKGWGGSTDSTDIEPDDPAARAAFTAARQKPNPVLTAPDGRRVELTHEHYSPSRDHDEMRRAVTWLRKGGAPCDGHRSCRFTRPPSCFARRTCGWRAGWTAGSTGTWPRPGASLRSIGGGWVCAGK